MRTDTKAELEQMLSKSSHAQSAMKNFTDGYNCCQATLLAFEQEIGLERKTLLTLSSSFGGGMGRLREVCGAVSAMFMVAGIIYGYDSAQAYEEKSEHYARIQELAERFQQYANHIVCRELLGLDEKKQEPSPEHRSPAYYQSRPCTLFVGLGAYVMEEYMSKNPT